MEMPEGWKRLMEDSEKIRPPRFNEYELYVGMVEALDLMKEMAESLEKYDDFIFIADPIPEDVGEDEIYFPRGSAVLNKAGLVLKKFKEWK